MSDHGYFLFFQLKQVVQLFVEILKEINNKITVNDGDVCLAVSVRPLEVVTNILIRSMGPVSEEDMVSLLFVIKLTSAFITQHRNVMTRLTVLCRRIDSS